MCTFILLLTWYVQNRVFRFRLVFTTSLRVCFVSVSPFWVYPPDVCLKQTHKQTKAQRSRRFYCLCKFYTLFETSLCWCWLVILLLYSYRHFTHTYIQTRDTHTTLFYTPKKKTNNILIRKAVWPPYSTCFRPPFSYLYILWLELRCFPN